jgi:hypothetical protein
MREPDSAYIAYEATVHHEVVISGGDAESIRGVLPDIDPGDLEKIVHLIKGRFHDGIEMGLSLSAADPIGPLEAYKLGDSEGYDRAIDDMKK